MSDSVLRVDKLENGYTVAVRDPKISAENEKPKSTWQDPWKEYAFSTVEEVQAFVGKHLGSLPSPPDPDTEFKTEFNRQAEAP